MKLSQFKRAFMLKNLMIIVLVFGVLFFLSLKLYKDKLSKQNDILKISKITELKSKIMKKVSPKEKKKDTIDLKQINIDSDDIGVRELESQKSDLVNINELDDIENNQIYEFDLYPVEGLSGGVLQSINTINTAVSSRVTNVNQKNIMYKKLRHQEAKKYRELQPDASDAEKKTQDGDIDKYQTGRTL